MSNPYLSLRELTAAGSLEDATSVVVMVPGANGGPATPRFVDLQNLRDDYLLVEVMESLAALQNRPANGAFQTPITMTVAGALSGSATFDGSGNFTFTVETPPNSIPLDAVQDLSSLLTTILQDLEVDSAANTLGYASYYADMSASSQNSVLGYWNPTSKHITGLDQYGVVASFSSTGEVVTGPNVFLNQLCMGANGTLVWRANISGGGWAQTQIWTSNNFSPENYVETATAVDFASLGLTYTEATAGQSLLTVTTSGASAAAVLQDLGATGVGLKLIGNGNATPSKTLRVYNGVMQVLNDAGDVVAVFDDAGNFLPAGALKLANGHNLVWAGGANVSSNATGSTVTVSPGNATDAILQLLTKAGAAAVTWDNDGNQSNSAALAVAGPVTVGEGNAQGNLYFGQNTTNYFYGNATSSGVDGGNGAPCWNYNFGSQVFTIYGTSSNVTSDERLKRAFDVIEPRPLWRGMEMESWIYRPSETRGYGPTAQSVLRSAPEYVREDKETSVTHLTGGTGRQISAAMKRIATGKEQGVLTVDKPNLALEMAMAAGRQADRALEMAASAGRQVERLEAEVKQLKKLLKKKTR
jgi:hypothetical protein